ncbi:MAG: hypothetical protein FD180_17 [Planctomycetota bacterium]|nr:MAG: hypothetical protein FD180_17 [Planctomycetota bacterium]
MKTLMTAAIVAAGLLLGGCGKSEDGHAGHNHGPKDAAAAKGEKGHEGHSHGGEPVKVSSNSFEDSIGQMEERLKTIDGLIASGKLDEVHREAEVICTLAKGMPEQTQGWPADKSASAAESAAKLAGMFREIDEVADAGKPDETKAATAKMRDLVAKLKALSPGTKHDHDHK